jgi:lipopolysaccharide transport system permease protein
MTSTSAPIPFLSILPPRRWAPLSLRELWIYRELLYTLAERDIKVRYKQTLLGVLWVVLQPLLAAAIFAFVFGRIAKMSSDGVPFIVFSYAGLLGWNAFNSTLSRSSASVVENARLVSKVYFPRLMLPVSTLGTTLIDFAVSCGLLVIMMAVYRIVPSWPLLLLPVWLALLLAAAVGMGLYTSALMVTYRDLQYALPPFLQLMLYACPVAYSASSVPAGLRKYYYINPLAGLLEAFRWSILGHGAIHWGGVAYDATFVIILLAGGLLAFKRMERKFADVL